MNHASECSRPSVEFPDQRYFQFHTWSAQLRLIPHGDDEDGNYVNPQNGGITEEFSSMTRFDIADDTGDWVGTIMLDKGRIDAGDHGYDNLQYEFLALSDAKSFTEQENPVWTYYIPKERHESQWDVYFVMMIERGRGGIASRVGLGKVFKAAFDNACGEGKAWKEMILR